MKHRKRDKLSLCETTLLPSIAQKQWEIFYQVSLSLDSPSLRGTLFISIPASIPLRQEVQYIESNVPAKETTDEYGNRWLAATPQHSPFQKFTFSYQSKVCLFPIRYHCQAFSEPWPPASQRFLSPEPGIESHSPEIQKLARQLTGESSLHIIFQTAQLVHQKLSYKIQPKEYGALYAIRNREGDCTEYASLFVALLRARGIGARINLGYVGEEELHAIAEIYMGGIWVPVDITTPLTGLFGLSSNFLTFMRANWMSHRIIEKLVSFSYAAFRPSQVKIKTKMEISSLSPKAWIISSHSLNYPIYPTIQTMPLQITIQKKKHYQIHFVNPKPWEIKGSILVVGVPPCLSSSSYLTCLKVKFLHLAPQSQTSYTLFSQEIQKYLSEYPNLYILFIDEVEKNRTIAKISH